MHYCHMFLNDFRLCWMMVRCQVLHGSYSRKIHSRVRGWSTWRWKLPSLWRLETNLKNIGLDLKQAAVYKKIGGLLGFAFVYWWDFVAPGNATNIRGSNIWGSSGRRSLRHFSGPFTRWGFLPEYGWAPLKDTRSLQSPGTFESLFEHWDNWWGAPGYYEFGVYKCKADLRWLIPYLIPF